jgi:hypothetical protein
MEPNRGRSRRLSCVSSLLERMQAIWSNGRAVSRAAVLAPNRLYQPRNRSWRSRQCLTFRVSGPDGSRDHLNTVSILPRAIQQFAGALMQRSKTDLTAAVALREYATRMPFVDWLPHRCPRGSDPRHPGVNRLVQAVRRRLSAVARVRGTRLSATVADPSITRSAFSG